MAEWIFLPLAVLYMVAQVLCSSMVQDRRGRLRRRSVNSGFDVEHVSSDRRSGVERRGAMAVQ